MQPAAKKEPFSHALSYRQAAAGKLGDWQDIRFLANGEKEGEKPARGNGNEAKRNKQNKFTK